MPIKKRVVLIRKIEKQRNTRLISYLTGDRQPFATRIADDVIPLLKQHLQKIGFSKKISLFLYTRGGDMLTPLRLVKLIRNYCDYFEVIVPYRAHSAGTLIALGADNVVMGKMSELSPIDPTTGHPYNPKNQINPNQLMEISVEDFNSYFLFAKEKLGIKNNQMENLYTNLSKDLHPLAIGNVYRGYRMVKMLGERLLKIHMHSKTDTPKIEKIINNLTNLICIHHYPITADEAKEMGLKVEKLENKDEKVIEQLYENYAQEMNIENPFNAIKELGDSNEKDFSYHSAYLESKGVSNVFVFRGKLQKIQQSAVPLQAAVPLQVAGQINVNINIQSQGWEGSQ